MSPVESAVAIGLLVLCVYLAVGVVVAVYLHARKLGALDPGVKGGGIAFRLIITPGLVALWPLMVKAGARSRNAHAEPPAAEAFASARALRARHRHYTRLIAVVVPIVVAVALVSRPKAVVNAALLPKALQEAALPVVVREIPEPFPGHAIALRVRSDERGATHQVELEVREPLEAKGPLLYFVPEGGASMHIGAVPGEGTHRFAIPGELAASKGEFSIYYAADNTSLQERIKEAR